MFIIFYLILKSNIGFNYSILLFLFFLYNKNQISMDIHIYMDKIHIYVQY